jgi:cytochrome c-type biogenesis protein CcmH
MILWAALTLMIALAVAGLTIPLVRRYDLRKTRATGLDVLKVQLGEVDAAQAGGVSQAEAEALRGEIKRRILAETPPTTAVARPIPAQAMPWLALGVVAVVALAAAGLYATMGHPEIPSATAVASNSAAGPGAVSGAGPQAAGTAQHPMGDVTSMIAGLEAKLQQQPNDPQGWQMLAWSYMRTNRPADAAIAYGRAVALDPKNPEYLSAQGEAMVQAADGKIPPEAAAIFRRATAADPTDPRARYFLAMFKDQQGDRNGAMTDWIALLKSAPADAPWLPAVRSEVEEVARERGINIADKLPPAPAAPPAASAAMPAGPMSAPPPGPTGAQIAAAGQMSDSDRQAMIHSMVDKLAADLKTNPRNPDGWERLMRARMVLGEKDQAAAAYQSARQAFAGAPSQQAALRDVAHGLGIPGA